MNCSKKDCPHEGTQAVIILVYADKHHPPLEMILGANGREPLKFKICRWHAATLTVADVLTEAGKRQLEGTLMDLNLAPPDWTLTEVKCLETTG